MAKHRQVSVAVPFWQIAWFAALNFSRQADPIKMDSPKMKELTQSLKTHGFIMDRSVHIVKITPELADEEVKRRTGLIARLRELHKVTPTPTSEYNLAMFEFLYCDKDGAVRTPQYRGFTGHCRAEAYPIAMAQRAEMMESKDFDAVTNGAEFPAILYQDISELELVEMQAIENQLNITGVNVPTPEDCYFNVRKAVEYGAPQDWARDTYKAGTGRKYWYLAKVDNAYPALDIGGRILDKDSATRWWSLAKFTHQNMREVYVRSDKDLLAEENLKRQGKGQPDWSPMNEQDITFYFETLMGRGGVPVPPPVKMLEKKTVEGMSTGHRNQFVKAAMTAVAKGDVLHLQKLDGLTDGANALYKIGPNTILNMALNHLSNLSPTDFEECLNRVSELIGSYPVVQTPNVPAETIPVERLATSDTEEMEEARS